MRILLGMVLGAVLTVALAYFYDLRTTSAAAAPAATEQRPMVNWDVVGTNWRELKARALQSWTKVAG